MTIKSRVEKLESTSSDAASSYRVVWVRPGEVAPPCEAGVIVVRFVAPPLAA
jgi:hypothetical protein